MPGTYISSSAGSAAPRDAALDAVREHLGRDGVAVLGTAAALHGLPVPWPPDHRVHVALPPGHEQHQRGRVCFHTWLLRPDEVCTVEGRPVTTVERTLADLMCQIDRLSAVAALDAALHLGVVSTGDVERLRHTTTHRRGAARSRAWWREADPRAESALETRARLRAVDGGYPPDELQLRIPLDAGTAFGDLAWRMQDGRWLVLEADGRAWHDGPTPAHRDRHRSNAVMATGDAVIARVIWSDTVEAGSVPRLLRSFLGPPRSGLPRS